MPYSARYSRLMGMRERTQSHQTAATTPTRAPANGPSKISRARRISQPPIFLPGPVRWQQHQQDWQDDDVVRAGLGLQRFADERGMRSSADIPQQNRVNRGEHRADQKRIG